MRLVVSAVLSLSLAAVALGQRGGHGGGGMSRGGGGFSHGGFGGGVSRGGGFSRGGFGGGVARGGFSTGFARGGVSAGFNRGGGVFRGGGIYHAPFRGNMFYRNGLGRGFRYRWPIYGYYGYPFYGASYYNDPYFYNDSYYGSAYPNSYTSGYYPPEPYVESYEPASEPQIVYAPPTAVNQGPPVARTNAAPEYLIAFNDHNIKLVAAYWTEKANLRYVTADHEIKTVPLSSVDRDLSVRLNHERRVTFNLPSGP
jgi:hypothetical protein